MRPLAAPNRPVCPSPVPAPAPRYPLAVGSMLVSTTEAQRARWQGKGLRVLHVVYDHLWCDPPFHQWPRFCQWLNGGAEGPTACLPFSSMGFFFLQRNTEAPTDRRLPLPSPVPAPSP